MIQPKTNLLIIKSLFLRKFFDFQYLTITRELRKTAKNVVTLKILDIGCGDHPYTYLFNYQKYTTVDPHYPNTDFQSIDEIKQDSFDLILLIEVLEHVKDPIELLSKIKNLMHTDSKIVITTPFSARIHPVPHDYQRWTPQGMEELLNHAGLSPQQITIRGNNIATITNKILYYNVKLFEQIWSFPLATLLFLFISLPLTVLTHLSLLFNFPLNDDPLGLFVVAQNKKN